MNKKQAKLAIITANNSLVACWSMVDTAQDRVDELQVIIDAPEPKTGRVMSVDDLTDGMTLWKYTAVRGADVLVFYFGCKESIALIQIGILFYDANTCEKYIEQLKSEQKMRILFNE